MKKLVLIAIILTFLIKLILPLDFYTGDNVLHIPFIKYFQLNGLFQNDYLFKSSNTNLQSKISIYYPVLAFITKNIDLPITAQLNIIHYLYLFLLYLVILVTTKRLNQSIFTGIIFCLIISLRFHIGGAAVTSVESTILPRGIGMIFGLWGLFFMLFKKYTVSFILFFTGLIFHPLTVFYFMLLIFIWFSNKKYSFIRITVFLLLILIVISIFTHVSEIRLNILKFRNPYAFIYLWSTRAWFNLLIVLAPGIFYFLLNKSKNNIYIKFIKISYFTSLVMSLFNIIFLFFIPSSLIISLQLGRIWFFPAAVSLFILSKEINKYCKYKTEKIIMSVMLLMFIILFNKRDMVTGQTPYLQDWINIQQWIRSNTGKNCLFLTPFYLSGFRIESERATTGEYKDGTLSFYSTIFANEWKKRLNDLRSWETLSDDKLMELENIYRFDYLVAHSNILPDREVVYKNNSFKLIDFNKNKQCD